MNLIGTVDPDDGWFSRYVKIGLSTNQAIGSGLISHSRTLALDITKRGSDSLGHRRSFREDVAD
jgi:hypothetical protein